MKLYHLSALALLMVGCRSIPAHQENSRATDDEEFARIALRRAEGNATAEEIARLEAFLNPR